MLHLTSTTNSTKKYLQFLPYKRFFLPRQYLLELSSSKDFVLSYKSLKVLISWITNRYSRQGLPDAFNERIKKAKPKIEQALRTLAGDCYCLFIRFKEEEIATNETYFLELKMLVDPKYYQDEATFSKINRGFEKIVELLSEISGIEVFCLNFYQPKISVYMMRSHLRDGILIIFALQMRLMVKSYLNLLKKNKVR